MTEKHKDMIEIKTKRMQLSGQRSSRVLGCLLMLISLGACGDRKSLNWTEEAQLPDGRVVTLTRLTCLVSSDHSMLKRQLSPGCCC